jgi:myo-inositol 2-dehydrogenase/D-chiro-inositol 1-dehydrogenase
MIRFAVLGCGRIGRMHARNLARHPRAQLVSVFDIVAKSAADTAAELGVPTAATVEEVLGDARVQAVLIATSTDTHVPLIIAAAKAGKAVLCEKPIDLDLKRAEACGAEIAPLEATVMIGFNRRFDPSFRAVHTRVQAGEIGRLEQLVITSRDPAPPPVAYIKVSGGIFRDMTIHDFDLARFMAGDIESVYATGGNLIDPDIGAAGDIDAAMIVLRAKSGALVHINNSRRCAYGYDQRVEAFGATGMLQAQNRFATSVQHWGKGGTGTRDTAQPFFIERYTEAYAAEIDHFVESVLNRTPPTPSFADGVAALKLAEAAGESLRSGRAISLG